MDLKSAIVLGAGIAVGFVIVGMIAGVLGKGLG